MSDPALSNSPNDAEVRPIDAAPKKAKRSTSMFNDPVVQTMVWIALGLVILFLATIVSALFTGVMGTSTPRTYPERQVAFAESAIEGGDHSPTAYANYVGALGDIGQFSKAQNVLDTLPTSARGTTNADVEVAQARLYLAEKKYAAVVPAADKAMKIIKTKYDADLKKAGTNFAKAYGLNANYYDAALIKGLAQQASGDARAAVASFDLYLGKNPMESNVLVNRAEAKLKLNDIPGARADYKAALRYVPDLPRALDGLKKIGAQ